tara:strand:+ start:4700 stop:7480 length:2781 start_codon:yes stop_codon:yes gene_type:complete
MDPLLREYDTEGQVKEIMAEKRYASENAKAQFYEDNILNKYDNVTYNWTMYMVNPKDVNQYDDILKTDSYRVIAQSGVEAEIGIESVTQDMKLAFNKDLPDREALANVFSMRLVEPMGATLYSRIYKAAEDLGIMNHLKACYLLELKFLGYTQDGEPIADITAPYYYACTMAGLDFQYNEGATQYRADLIETTQDAFKKLSLHLKEDIPVQASTFGEFLENFEFKVNEQERLQVVNSSARKFWHTYKFGVTGRASEWNTWAFDTGAGNSGETADLSSVSITGSGNLTFNIKQGTSISDIIIVALMQTTNFRKLPTDEGGFHKENPNDPNAKPFTFSELSKWFVFDNKVNYRIFDPVAKDFAKDFEYNINAIAVPELIHDVGAYEKVLTDQGIQEDRIKGLINKKLLVKRFDYHFTGLNTEVLGLDIYLNNTYYQIQALNQGRGKFIGQAFEGEGDSSNEYNIAKNTADEIKQKIQDANDELQTIQGQRDSFFDGSQGIFNPNELAAKEAEFNQRQEQQQEVIKQLEQEQKQITEKLIPLTEQEEAQQKLEQGQFKVTGSKYLTQSELIGTSSSNDARDHQLPFDFTNINSKATNGPDDKDTSGAVMLGAVELNLNSLGDLVQQQISVRGDPYWLGRPKSRTGMLNGAEYTRGGVSYFLNLNFPTYPEHETGLMNIPEANFGVVGVYRVHTVVANYDNGQFTMTLQSFRDSNTNVGKLWEILSTGEIDKETEKNQEPFKPGDEQGENDQEGEENQDNSGSSLPEELQDGDGTGTVTQNQLASGKIRNQAIASDLNSILSQAGAAAGVNVIVESGGQPAKGTSPRRTGSTRHDNGHAADVQLALSNGRILSLNNPADVPIIQNFIKETKRFGATGIGAGNGYMGDNTFHIDNASAYGQGSAGYWGGHYDNGTYRARNAPRWLKDIFTA